MIEYDFKNCKLASTQKQKICADVKKYFKIDGASHF